MEAVALDSCESCLLHTLSEHVSVSPPICGLLEGRGWSQLGGRTSDRGPCLSGAGCWACVHTGPSGGVSLREDLSCSRLQFSQQEEKRQKAERLQQQQKHENQMRDMVAQCESNMSELQQLQVPPRPRVLAPVSPGRTALWGVSGPYRREFWVELVPSCSLWCWSHHVPLPCHSFHIYKIGVGQGWRLLLCRNGVRLCEWDGRAEPRLLCPGPGRGHAAGFLGHHCIFGKGVLITLVPKPDITRKKTTD